MQLLTLKFYKDIFGEVDEADGETWRGRMAHSVKAVRRLGQG